MRTDFGHKPSPKSMLITTFHAHRLTSWSRHLKWLFEKANDLTEPQTYTTEQLNDIIWWRFFIVMFK